MIILTPYFVPGDGGTELLTGLVKKGVRVRILTNSARSNDVSVVHTGYMKFRMDLLRGGVEVHELRHDIGEEARKAAGGAFGSEHCTLHAKSFVFDRERIFVGSLNLDPRPTRFNTEVGVVLESGEIAGQLANWFDENIEHIAYRLELKKNYYGSELIIWHSLEQGRPQAFFADPHTGFLQRFGMAFVGLLPIENHL